MEASISQLNKNSLIVVIALGLTTSNAFASSRTTNFATGQDSNGNIQLTGNSLDANWAQTAF